MRDNLYLVKKPNPNSVLWVIAPDEKTAKEKAIKFWEKKGIYCTFSSVVATPYTVDNEPVVVDNYHREGENLVFHFALKSGSYEYDDIRFGVYEANQK